MQYHPKLTTMTYLNLHTFICCASHLKDDILQPQPHTVSVVIASAVLPPSITGFLAIIAGISVNPLWDIMLRSGSSGLGLGPERALEEQTCTVQCTLYPPVKKCINPECNAWQMSKVLKKEEQCAVIVFMLADSAHPAWSVHLKCQGELQTVISHYKNPPCILNSSVQISTLYRGVPLYIQVAKHQFIQQELAMQCMYLMQVAVSATNCARLYDIAQSHHQHGNMAWQFDSMLMTEQVWDSFTLLALLDDHNQFNLPLQVPHNSDQKDHFRQAMCTHTERIITHGQEELPHACDSCVWIFCMPDETVVKMEVVMMDGVTIGHPCCAVPQCKNPLDNNHH
ncbi:hypothetical protein PAXRUDRAFT_148350 [Paxillus rubicundulus Ve08.2h10]|uniref:Unplaced genomic scaffold scaffold_508, whole genome shotgun sequence n=1 Tax=Paxillus rubicundulus Ve08.2h10 TaxID=930991 RepID=A0A0D0E465_9AGAM|nr:hypothetical protein PAXRUDRAFT_148350 [Paxillus rubicundulus Ve08.2h10]